MLHLVNIYYEWKSLNKSSLNKEVGIDLSAFGHQVSLM